MKRVMFLFMCIILTVIVCGCSPDTDEWETIFIENCGSFKIPDEWDCFFEDDIIYIVNNQKPVMISYQRTGELESNSYFTDFRHMNTVTSACLSNGAIYGKSKYFYSGMEIERLYLDFGETTEGKWIEFLVWDEDVTKELIVKIAGTFVSEL